MRKFLGILMVMAASSAALADVLLWQVASSETLTDIGASDYNYAKIMATADNGATVEYLASYISPSSTTKIGGTTETTANMASSLLSSSATGKFYADLSSLGSSYTAYSFAVELFSSDGTALGHVGWTSASDLSGAIASQATFNENWATMSAGLGSSGWAGGAVSTPEPTSGLLMLLGAALLGLKRRRVA